MTSNTHTHTHTHARTHTHSYFAEIATQLEAETDEETRSLLVGNALEEARGQAAELAMDPRTSRTLQGLLQSAGDDDLLGYLSAIGCSSSSSTTTTAAAATASPRFLEVCCSGSGSHVLETLFASVADRLRRPDYDAKAQAAFSQRAEEALAPMCEAVAAKAYSVGSDRAGSPAARSLVSLLCGRGVGAKSGTVGQRLTQAMDDDNSNDAAASTSAAPPPYLLPMLLNTFTGKVLESASPEELWDLAADTAGSGFLQALVRAHAQDEEALAMLIPSFLGSEPGAGDGNGIGERLSCVPAERFEELMSDRAGSHLAEAVLQSVPPSLFTEIFTRFCMGRLLSLALHPVSNFAVQGVFAAIKEKGQARLALHELRGDFKVCGGGKTWMVVRRHVGPL